MLKKNFIAEMSILLLAFFISIKAQFFYQDFDIGSHDLEELGFKARFWTTDSIVGNWFMKNISPKEKVHKYHKYHHKYPEYYGKFPASVAYTNTFNFIADRNMDNGFTVEYTIIFPDTCVKRYKGIKKFNIPHFYDKKFDTWEIEKEYEGCPKEEINDYISFLCKKPIPKWKKKIWWGRKFWHKWKIKDKVWVSVLDCQTNRPVFTLLFMPNITEEDTSDINVILRNNLTGRISFGRTKKLTPYGTGENIGIVNLKIIFLPEDSIKVFYGENFEYNKDPVIKRNDNKQVRINKLRFIHKKGLFCRKNLHVFIDNISVRQNNTIVHRTTPEHVFSQALYRSDGQNVTDTFDIRDLRQSAFQLFTDIGGGEALYDWDEYIKMIHGIASTTEDMNGLPLLIAKAQFYSLTAESMPEFKTFFMASFIRNTIHTNSINIIFPYGTEYSTGEDIVENVTLEIEDDIIEIDSTTGIAEYEFEDEGEKFFKATVNFSSGFVGTNLFHLTVKKLKDGRWYNLK